MTMTLNWIDYLFISIPLVVVLGTTVDMTHSEGKGSVLCSLTFARLALGSQHH